MRQLSRRLRVVSFLLAWVVPARASFEFQPLSVRASSMGGTLLAAGDDPACLFSQPAGLASLARPRLSLAYAQPFAGEPGVRINSGHAALSLPGHWAVGAGALRVPGLAQEEIWSAGYGFGASRWQAGFAAKYLRRSFLADGADPVFQARTARGAWAWDAGASIALGGPMRLALVWRNVNRPDLGLAAPEKLPRELQAGLGLDLPAAGFKAAGDFIRRDLALGRKGRSGWMVGVEKALYRDTVFLRTGAGAAEWTGGLGLAVGAFRWDYSLAWRSAAGGDMLVHRTGLVWRFDGPEGQRP